MTGSVSVSSGLLRDLGIERLTYRCIEDSQSCPPKGAFLDDGEYCLGSRG